MKIPPILAKHRYVFILSIIYLSFIIVLQPQQFDKPYLDGFAYAQSVKHLVTEGQLKISEWSAVTLIAQVYWGAFFTRLLGFSFNSLMYSTLFLLYFGLLAFYFILREFELSEFSAFLFSLAFLGYPWVWLLAFSFMTDIPYISVFNIALLFYIKGLKKQKIYFYSLGSVFATVSFFIRQLGMILPLSVGIILIIQAFINKKFDRGLIIKFMASLFIPLLSLFIYLIWLNIDSHMTLAQIYSLKNTLWHRADMLLEIYRRIGFYTVNMLVLSWPLLYIFKPARSYLLKILKPKFILSVCFLYLVLLGSLWISGTIETYFPVKPDRFTDYSTGAGQINSSLFSFYWNYSALLNLPVLALFLAVVAKIFVDRIIKRPSINAAFGLLIVSFLATLTATLVVPYRWANYTIAFLPFLITILAKISKYLGLAKYRATFIIATILLLSSLNAGITHTIKDAIWDQGESLVQKGVDPARISTGLFSWYPWWSYEKTLNSELAKVNYDKRKLPYWLVTGEIAKDNDPQYLIKFERYQKCPARVQFYFFKGYICVAKLY